MGNQADSSAYNQGSELSVVVEYKSAIESFTYIK